MIRKNASRTWNLGHGQTVELDDARGTHLRVERGTLWVTMERDLRDIVLQPGEHFVIGRNGVTLIQAQGRTLLTVSPSEAPAAAYARANLWAWLLDRARVAVFGRAFVPHL